MNKYTLGIWDGHDAGAALLNDGRIFFAIQEERLSRRKLEVGFPQRSIKACLDYAGISAADIREIGVSTTDPAKTLTRILPGLKEEYYLLRRRKKDPGALDPFKKRFKYWFTELRPNAISNWLSRRHLEQQLQAMGFRSYRLSLIDHHEAHARAAAFCSGFDHGAVLTLDGVGDGVCGSLWRFDNDKLELVRKLPARASLGIFFEHVTNLMNMRELEDEGKVMALANYAYPIDDSANPMLELIRTRGLDIVSDYRANAMFRQLKKILWRYPSEQFAYMAQRCLEKNALDLVREACRLTGAKNIALAGGIFSNVKLNMKIAELPEMDRVFVFPGMGDGGLAVGAAIAVAPAGNYTLPDLYLGPNYSEAEVSAALGRYDFSCSRCDNPAAAAARLILAGEIILWFQGRMEYGPRSLGNRSILARPDDPRIKDQLNLLQKKRVWYQPFCPAMLAEDAPSILVFDGRNDMADNRFMTTAFQVRPGYLDLLAGVINIDGTCRPQLLKDENPVFRDLLLEVKKGIGQGVVLNTSCNVHGEPVVCSPDDALKMLGQTRIKYLFIENLLVKK